MYPKISPHKKFPKEILYFTFLLFRPAVHQPPTERELIDKFGDNICFTYPKDRKKSQMFFSANIRSTDIAETLRHTNPLKACAEDLRSECHSYDLGLKGSFHSAENLSISYSNYRKHRPTAWSYFFDSLFPNRTKSEHIMRKCDTIFQIVFNTVHNGESKTPLHVSLTESVHDTCKSKNLIQILNRMGLCMSYDELQRIDMGLAQRTIDLAGDCRVPLPPVIQDGVMLHGAMDNYDNNESTLSGIGSSHDTIMMLFQNTKEISSEQIEMNKLPDGLSIGRRALEHILDCQKIVRSGKFSRRATVPSDFNSRAYASDPPISSACTEQYKMWVRARHRTDYKPESELSGVPSFNATTSLLSSEPVFLTKIAFTPIIPNPATEYDTIYTAMVNFQDVLTLKKIPYAPLWSDEGVYRIAKELQLFKPEKFQNIFLGIGGFHMEKVILACCGKYLEESGIGAVLVENEIYGPGVINSVMDGGNYVRSKRGIAIITEAMEHLQMVSFVDNIDQNVHESFLAQLSDLRTLFREVPLNQKMIVDTWNTATQNSAIFEKAFEDFQKNGCTKSTLFQYWDTFIHKISPVIRDLAKSFRDGDWNVHLSALWRALPLCFAFDRINYKRRFCCPTYNKKMQCSSS